MFKIINKFQGAKIFKEKRLVQINNLLRLVSQLDKEDERDVIMWTLNKRSGKWRHCLKCGNEAGKEHMEKCILNEGSLDDQIKSAKGTKDLENVARKIKIIQNWIK